LQARLVARGWYLQEAHKLAADTFAVAIVFRDEVAREADIDVANDAARARQSRRVLINANVFASPGVRDLASRVRERRPEGLQEIKVPINGAIRNNG